MQWEQRYVDLPVWRNQHFQFFDEGDNEQVDLAAFSRQILAFGEEFQRLLKKLHIGIAGLGGTGSAVCEQLVRLGDYTSA
jgi:hypothetical protein